MRPILLPAVLALVLPAIFALASEKDQGVDTPVPRTRLADKTAAMASPAGFQRRSLDDLRGLSRNPSNTAEGAIISYEIREMIADRLSTNEAFRQWATGAVMTTVCKLVQNPKFTIYGSAAVCPTNLEIQVNVLPVGGLRATAIYDPNTDLEGPLEFVVEGGTNPCVSMAQNRYRMFDYQTDESSWGTPMFPRSVGRMDWGKATQPLDTGYLDALARDAYFAMTGRELGEGVQAKIDVSAVIDPSIEDPSVQTSGKAGARVQTNLNRRYPCGWIHFHETDSSIEPFSGEVFQSTPGRGEFVSMNALRGRDRVQGAIFELGEEFLTPFQSDWAEEVYSKIGSTPPDQVLEKLWKTPKR